MAVAEMGDRLATINMGRKVGGAWLLCPFPRGSWVPIEHNVVLLFIRRQQLYISSHFRFTHLLTTMEF